MTYEHGRAGVKEGRQRKPRVPAAVRLRRAEGELQRLRKGGLSDAERQRVETLEREHRVFLQALDRIAEDYATSRAKDGRAASAAAVRALQQTGRG